MRDIPEVLEKGPALARAGKRLATLALGALLSLWPAARAFGDTTPPATTLSVSGGLTFARFGQTYATPQAGYVLSASDAESGVASISYSIDGGLVQAYSQPLALPDGFHTIRYFATDNAGNAQPPQTAAFNVSPFENDALTGGGTGEDSIGGSIISSGTLLFNGPFTANGGATIYGEVTAPSISISNNSTLYGGRTIASNVVTPAPFDLSLARANATASSNNAAIAAHLSNGVLTAGSGNLTLPAGNYVLSGINLNGSIVKVAGKVGLYVQGPISMSGGARLNGEAGADTENLVIFSDSDQGISLTGGAVLGAYLYAPNAALSITGGFRGGGHIFINTCKVNGNGPSVFASGRTVPSLPGVPPAASDLAGAAQSVSSILWTWVDNDTTADGYRVMSGADNLSGDLPLGASSWLQTGLSPNAASGPLYVQAFNASGTSDSNLASRYTLAAVPSGLAADAVSSTTISVSWSAAGNPAGTVYELFRSVSGGSFSSLSSGAALGVSDAGLTPATAYSYEARALNGDGAPSAFGAAATATTQPPHAPAAATAFLGTPQSPSSILWTWTDTASNAAGYSVMSGTLDLSGPLAADATSWLQTGLSPSTTYGPFFVRAFNAGGAGDSNAASTSTFADVPTGLAAAVVSSTSLSLSWSAGGNGAATIYELYCGPAGDSLGLVSSGTSPSAVYAGLTPLTDYVCEVRALNSDGWRSAFGDPLSVTTLGPDAPVGGAGLGLTATALSPTSIRWSWNDAAVNQDGYRLLSGGVNLSGDLPRGATSWVQTDLSPNVLYGPYVVQAFNAGGTGDSNAASRYTLAAVPSGLAADAVSSTTIAVTWFSNGNSTATVYQLVGSTMGGTYFTLKESLETVYSNESLSPSTTYLYMVRAINAEMVATEFTGVTSAASLAAPTVVASASTLDSVRVYPNPFKPNGGNPDQGKPFALGDPTSGIIFDRLTSSIKLKIYTITGALVTELESSSGLLQWDAKTGGGHDVASGQYIAVLSSPGQKQAVKKILIIR